MAKRIKTINESLDEIKKDIPVLGLIASLNPIPQTGLDRETDSFIDDGMGRLRTVFLNWVDLGDKLLEFKCVRGLSLSGKCIKELPESIGMLRHLRLLRIKGTYIKVIPNSVCMLYNLQTLPHPNLKSLEIKYFKGEKFPSWLLGSDNIRGGLLLFDHLLEIRLSYCSKCEKLPTLGHLPSLKVLGIAEMYNVRCIGTEFYGSSNGEGSSNSRGGSGSTVLFPALEKLVLGHMRNLEEWNDVTEPTAELGMIFPRLERLQVWGCEKLTSAPHHFPSLKKLFISGIRGPAFEQIISELTTLTSLEIWEISELACLPEHFLQKNRSLMDLRIWNCADLKSILPRGHEWPICTSLRSLHIFRCDELRTLPRALCNLHCLEDIHVEACLNLSSFPSIKGIASSLQRLRLCCSDEVLPPGLQSCMSLQHLYIDHWPHLLSIPDLRNLHSLTVLIIACCPNLISIPDTKEFPSLTCLVIRDCSNLISIPVLKELPSLTRLEISGCPNLISIPDMRELPSLTDLEIRDCSNLISIPVLKELPSLTRLEISGCPNLISIPDMRELPSLTDLEIRDCSNLISIPVLKELPSLTRLSLYEIYILR
ncbi:putative disease resistance rpp13-like protein 1 [Quercus suber]|uniref:Disease resistance rpp13-like protein 1 n=1 Tax=Quercus suber TaxID=58331 RepID=A0AAW0LCF2_QUESU